MFTAFLLPSSLRAAVRVKDSSTTYAVPAPRSNLISLGECKEIFRTLMKTTWLQLQFMEIAASLVSFKYYHSMSLFEF